MNPPTLLDAFDGCNAGSFELCDVLCRDALFLEGVDVDEEWLALADGQAEADGVNEADGGVMEGRWVRSAWGKDG